MTTLSLDDGKRWLSANFNRISGVDMGSSFPLRVSFGFPKDAGGMTVLARCLSKLFMNERESFLWITDWGAFPNLSNMDLFCGYRKSFGESRSLIDAPFHVFQKPDTRKLESLLGLSLYFFWDAILGRAGWNVAISTSNDEFVDIHACHRSEMEVITSAFNGLGLKQVNRKGDSLN